MVLVFDVGATHTRMAVSGDGHGLGKVVRMDTDPSPDGFAKFLAGIEHLSKGQELSWVVGGLPGQFDQSGAIVGATNLPSWNGQLAGEQIQRLTGSKVQVANDVTMCGLGEAHAGAGSTGGVMVYFTISTGVNAARIVDGRIDETIRRYEIGKQLVPDGTGKLVSLESLTGGAAFRQEHGFDPSGLRDKRTWRSKEHHLAHGLYNTLVHWTPDLVVFGGSMMRDIDLGVVRDELEQLTPLLDGLPVMNKAILGDTGGLQGALAWYRQANELT